MGHRFGVTVPQDAHSHCRTVFDVDCRKCPRLASHLDDIRRRYPTYYTLPVPAFGASRPRLFIVGLAPGLHGANRTGRAFTGDSAGELLYRTLFHTGFCNQPVSANAHDTLVLFSCRISNALKCLPPHNKPTGNEIRNCNIYLRNELAQLTAGGVIVALGGVAHRAVIKALNLKLGTRPFGHGNEYELDNGRYLLDSYHCSRYNTRTGRLTESMFRGVFERVKALVGQPQNSNHG